MTNPIWILLDDGDTFEGHQLHWADCFFSNASRREIENAVACDDLMMGPVKLTIREMTDEEVAKYPEAVEFEKQLINQYGEC